MIKEEEYISAAALLKNVNRLTIVCHRKPDGDSLGAALAFYHALMPLGKKITLACIDAPSFRFSFLPGIEKFEHSFLYSDNEAIIVADAGDSKMTGFHEIHKEFLSNAVPIINIDHHASNDFFGKINLVDSSAASSTVIAFKLLEYMQIPFTKEIALCLLTGIYNDTGGFMHSNTSLEAFQIASRLAKTGVDVSVISKYMFRMRSFAQLKVWGSILDRLKIKNNVVSSVITLKDIHRLGGAGEDAGGVVDLINSVKEAQFALVISEDEHGYVKGSLRTAREDIDVADIAGRFGGGGHKKAAGFRMPGHLKQELVWKIVPADPGKEEFIIA